jgi:hypothetical protein
MNIVETECWTMALPPEWWAEAEGDSILVGDRDDVGCIEISTLHKDAGEFSSDDMQQMAKEFNAQGSELRKVDLGDFRGLQSSYVEEESAIREWYVASAGIALFITYSCELENQGMDDAAVNELLDTLMALTPEQ